jgi:ribosomal protein S18 acetylase RimI-like enzyme
VRAFQVRPLGEDDRDWATRLLEEHWGSATVVTRGRVLHSDKLPGFAAMRGNESIGLITYQIDSDECEIVSLNSLAEGIGIGSALIDAVKDTALSEKCRRLWLITTNDNLAALRFYQKRGFALVAIYRDALEKSRQLKPGVPLIGMEGIPLRDEIELEVLL